MLSIFNRQIGGKRRIVVDQFTDFKQKFIPCEKPSEIVINENYIIVLINRLAEFSKIIVYDINNHLENGSISNIPNISSITYINGKLYIISILDNKLALYELDIVSMTTKRVLKDEIIVFPGFIEVDISSKYLLVNTRDYYTVYDTDYNIIWRSSEPNIADVLIGEELIHIKYYEPVLNKSIRCSGINKNGKRCNRRQCKAYCSIHQTYKSSQIDLLNMKKRDHFINYNKSLYYNDVNRHTYFYSIDGKEMICRDIYSGIEKSFPYTNSATIIYINEYCFMLYDKTTVIYDYNCKPLLTIKGVYNNNDTYYMIDSVFGILTTIQDDLYYIIKIDFTNMVTKQLLVSHKRPNNIKYGESTIVISYRDGITILTP